MRIAEGIYLIGGPNLTRSEDAAAYVIDFSGELVMIDAGAGRSARMLAGNIEEAGLDPGRITHLILTHCHIDHIGAAPCFRDKYGCRLVAHELDAGAIEEGDPVMTAANWYETEFPPTPIDIKISGPEHSFRFQDRELLCIHTPGHTPGSISVFLERDGRKVLFGQDIHGPFLPSFGSDINVWRQSMEKLLALEPDILCEGHFGIFRSRASAEAYIKKYMKMYG